MPVVTRALLADLGTIDVEWSRRSVAMSNLNLQTVVYREGEHYVAQCLNVDVSSFGDSEAEALANLQEALELYFEDAPASDAAPVEAAEVRTLTLQGA
jgi:predicted RNase H-like HicB family nuclease